VTIGRASLCTFQESEDLTLSAVLPQLHNRDHAADAVRPAIEKVLRELQIEQLDLFLMHWPVTGNKGDTIEPPIKVRPSIFARAMRRCGRLFLPSTFADWRCKS
jgi:diketogulonate reductase-like aldo/keto reductase